MAVAWCVGEGEKHGGREHAEVWGATWVHEMEIPVSNCLLAWHQACLLYTSDAADERK